MIVLLLLNFFLLNQEALAIAKPGYIQRAEKRRLKISHKKEVRKKVHERNREILSELPNNLKVPKILNKLIAEPGMYNLHKCVLFCVIECSHLIPATSPVFDYKTIREQNRKIYRNLPEVTEPKILRKKQGLYHTNRLLANYYSKVSLILFI